MEVDSESSAMEVSKEDESPKKREEPKDMILVKCCKEKSSSCDIRVNNDVFRIGRGADNDGIILDVSISRSHCVLKKKDNNHWTITDSSSSGTILNGTKLKRNIVYPLKIDDELEFGDTKNYRYTFRVHEREEPEAKKPRLDENFLEEVLSKQKIFADHQECQMKDLQERILTKQKHTDELTSRLDELVKEQAAVKGESEEKNNQINLLEEQINMSKNHQQQLEDNMKQLVDTMEDERKKFEEKLNEERSKWQEELDMTKQEKEAFEKNMTEQMNNWKEQQEKLNEERRKWQETLEKTKQEKEAFEKAMTEQMNNWKQQQLATSASEKEILERQLKETQEALKEQAAVAEQFKSQQVLLSELPMNQDYVVFQVTEENDGKKLEILETIDLTGGQPSTSKNDAVGKKIMSAMDEQFTCSICQELFIKATTLNCTHTFCSYCIRSWRRKRIDCPICRTHILSMNRALVLDNFIDETVDNLPDEDRERRNRLAREREALEEDVARAAAAYSAAAAQAANRRKVQKTVRPNRR